MTEARRCECGAELPAHTGPGRKSWKCDGCKAATRKAKRARDAERRRRRYQADAEYRAKRQAQAHTGRQA